MSSIEQLLRENPLLWRGHQSSALQPTISTGFSTLDAFLPGGGWPLGALTELISAGPGCGELSLALPALSHITSIGQYIAFVAPPYPLYPPALQAAGIKLQYLWLVEPNHNERQNNGLWATEQLLRSGAFTAVVLWASHTSVAQQRRLQLAAEAGGACWALNYRPSQFATQPSPAALRLRWDGAELEILKCRGRNSGHRIRPQAHRPHQLFAQKQLTAKQGAI